MDFMPFSVPLPLQKKYRDTPLQPRGTGTASSAAFMSQGIGRNTGCPLFSVRRNMRHLSPSRVAFGLRGKEDGGQLPSAGTARGIGLGVVGQ